MKNLGIFLFALIVFKTANTQPCLPEGIVFYNQGQIDYFQANHPGCTEIEGNVIISDNGSGDIANLFGLSVLTSIGGMLQITGNSNLYFMTGLDNLTSVGGDLIVSQNQNLLSLTGLEGLNTIGGGLTIYAMNSEDFTDLEGLNNLSTIGGSIYIFSNYDLTSLSGLESLTSIGGDLQITENAVLNSLSGLANIAANTIMNLTITGNDNLSECNVQSICDWLANPQGVVEIGWNNAGCNSVIEVAVACGGAMPCLPYGDYYFTSQEDIDNFSFAFPGCTTLEGNVRIDGDDITSLSGLNSITIVGGDLMIYGNDALTSPGGLNSLTSVGGNFNIDGNSALTSLAGLGNLEHIGGDFLVKENNSLVDFTGLNNLSTIGGSLKIGYTIYWGGLGNPALSSLAGLESLSTVGEDFEISFNPSLISVSALTGLTTIGPVMMIKSNTALPSLSGLENISAGSIINLTITGNSVLSECNVQSVCNYLINPAGILVISGNAPGCSTQGEVLALCGEPCLPEGITFSTQADIDNFQANYPGCTSIQGEVIISGPGITNLNGLNTITSIGGNLIIIKNDLLTNLTGLDALTYIGGYLEIGDVGDEGNPLLTSLTGLESLASCGDGMSIRFNPVLASFDGLENLVAVNGFCLIQVNDALTDLTALSGLTTIGGSLRVEDNASLTSLAGLENINPQTIDNLFINRNPLLTSCEVESVCSYLASPPGTVYIFQNGPGCENPAEIAISCGTTFDCLPNGFYHFYSQSYIDNFHLGFPNCTILNEYAVISGDNITNLEGLSQITTVDGDLWILGNPLLTNLSGLDNLATITGELEVSGNTALTDLSGLEGLTTIEENLLIGYWYPNSNTVLSSLAGLANLTTLGGELSIKETLVLNSLAGLDNVTPNSLDAITIINNASLSACDVESVCEYLGFPNSTIAIGNNATGCNSIQEVSDACLGIGIEESQQSAVGSGPPVVMVWPNPSGGMVLMEYTILGEVMVTMSVSNHLGQQVAVLVSEQQQAGKSRVEWQPSGLPDGIYYYRLQAGNDVVTGKMILIK